MESIGIFFIIHVEFTDNQYICYRNLGYGNLYYDNMKFYNRERELTILGRIERLSTQTAQMTFMVGRRRIGKTSLLLKALLEESLNMLNCWYKLRLSHFHRFFGKFYPRTPYF